MLKQMRINRLKLKVKMVLSKQWTSHKLRKKRLCRLMAWFRGHKVVRKVTLSRRVSEGRLIVEKC